MVVLATIVPAWRGSALDPGVELSQTTRSATQSRAAAMWRHGLVTAQVAIVAVQLVAGGLLLHGFWKLQHVDPGFRGERVFAAEMRLLDPRYFDEGRLRGFQDELLARVRALPGVEAASITSSVPLRGVDWTRPVSHQGRRVTAKERDVDPAYFEVMGIPLLAGRGFSSADDVSAPPVVIISRALAAQLFFEENPVGKHLPIRPQQPHEVIGVVGDVRNVRVDSEGDPAYYVPRAQQSTELICLVVRTAEGTPDLAPAVRATVASIDPMQPVFNATTLDRVVSDSIADRRFFALATVAFAVITLLLSAAGLYGVTSYSISARTREIGVRVALGADPGRLARWLTAQSLRPVIAGLVLGVLAAFWASRLLEQFLFNVRGSDPLTYATVAAWVLGLTMLAALWPAVRACRVSPTASLRHD
jgi:putative ABC transport system permease protein